MSFEILSVNLDSLYLTVSGEWIESVKGLLAAAKQQAQDDDVSGVFLARDNRVAGGPLMVSRIGRSRDYPYMLYNARFRVQLSVKGGGLPVALVQVRSDLLYEYDLPAINTMVLRLLSNLFHTYSFKVGRADLACDFQSADWQFPDISDVLSRAKSDSLWREHRKTTGMTFGKHQSALQCQIYRKSETLKNDKKLWMFDLWAAENERFDPEIPVYRCELRFYREGLRLMKNENGEGLDTLWDLYHSLQDLVTYAVGGSSPWIRIVEPKYRREGYHSGGSQRWDNVSWWTDIVGAFLRCEGSQARKRVNDELRFHYVAAVERAAAHLRTAAAISRLAGWHPCTNPAKFASDALRAFYFDSPLDWADGINEKMEQIIGTLTADVAVAS